MDTRMNLRSRVFVMACSLAILIAMATVGGLRLAYAEPAVETKPAADIKGKPESRGGSLTATPTSDGRRMPPKVPAIASSSAAASSVPTANRSKANSIFSTMLPLRFHRRRFERQAARTAVSNLAWPTRLRTQRLQPL